MTDGTLRLERKPVSRARETRPRPCPVTFDVCETCRFESTPHTVWSAAERRVPFRVTRAAGTKCPPTFPQCFTIRSDSDRNVTVGGRGVELFVGRPVRNQPHRPAQ